MTDRYAVIGNPIGHSKSPVIHAAFAAETGQDIEYTAIEAPADGFAVAVDALRARGGRGLNVTAPFKQDAFRYATSLSPDARLAGAVNCLGFDGDTVGGHNFDGVGLLRDIEVNLRHPLAGTRVLLLGTGGATRGALLPFLAARPAALVVAGRSLEAAQGLANAAQDSTATAATYAQLEGQAPFDLVVNATSASVTGAMPPLPPGVFRGTALAYELIYGKGLTPFLHRARTEGAAQLADGIGMLVEQAAEAFVLWRGIRPGTAAIIRRFTTPLD